LTLIKNCEIEIIANFKKNDSVFYALKEGDPSLSGTAPFQSLLQQQFSKFTDFVNVYSSSCPKTARYNELQNQYYSVFLTVLVAEMRNPKRGGPLPCRDPPSFRDLCTPKPTISASNYQYFYFLTNP